MAEGWIKLHRMCLNNEVRRHHPTAWRVFETLLLLVDQDTGQWSGGRFQLAEIDGSVHPSSIYRSLKILQSRKMLTLTPNTKYTTISICNWSNFQTKRTLTPSSDRTATEHSNKNKELRIKENIKRKVGHGLTWLNNVPPEDVESIAQIKHVSREVVESTIQAALNWYGVKPDDKTRQGRDWRLTVMGWIEKDIKSGKVEQDLPKTMPPEHLERMKELLAQKDAQDAWNRAQWEKEKAIRRNYGNAPEPES